GVPSISIYVNELMNDYDVQKLVRVGTCGGMQEDVNISDVILAQGSTTDSQMNRKKYGSVDYESLATFDILNNAHNITEEKGLTTYLGNVCTSDIFYRYNGDAFTQLLMDHRVLVVEMATTALYTLAAKFNRQALSILTVSDHIITG